MLTKEDEKDEFYYCLYLLSMLSNTSNILRVIEHIVKGLNSFRVKRKVTSTEEFLGDIDIETYIARNYVEKTSPKEYPSIIKCSTFQMPEYQLTLYIIRRIENIYHAIFRVLGDNEKVTAFNRSGVPHELYVVSRVLVLRLIAISLRKYYTALVHMSARVLR